MSDVLENKLLWHNISFQSDTVDEKIIIRCKPGHSDRDKTRNELC